MDVDFRLVNAGYRLDSFRHGVLYVLCDADDVAAIANKDDRIDLDGIVNYLDLDALGQRLDADHFRKLRTDGV